VDFVAEKPEEKIYIQVTETMKGEIVAIRYDAVTIQG
jgi:hypothetical protein